MINKIVFIHEIINYNNESENSISIKTLSDTFNNSKVLEQGFQMIKNLYIGQVNTIMARTQIMEGSTFYFTLS